MLITGGTQAGVWGVGVLSKATLASLAVQRTEPHPLPFRVGVDKMMFELRNAAIGSGVARGRLEAAPESEDWDCCRPTCASDGLLRGAASGGREGGCTGESAAPRSGAGSGLGWSSLALRVGCGLGRGLDDASGATEGSVLGFGSNGTSACPSDAVLEEVNTGWRGLGCGAGPRAASSEDCMMDCSRFCCTEGYGMNSRASRLSFRIS